MFDHAFSQCYKDPKDALTENDAGLVVKTEFRAGSQRSKAYAMSDRAATESSGAMVYHTEFMEIDHADNFLSVRNLRNSYCSRRYSVRKKIIAQYISICN